LLIGDEEHESDQDVLTFGNNFEIEYEQLLEAYNEGHHAVVLIKNVTIITKGN